LEKNKRTLQRIVKQVATRAGISKTVTPHVLRHTFAVFSLQAGLSLASLIKILGHDRLETTQIYLNLSGEDAVRECLEKIG
jgi:integrase/recombinase XerD